MLLLPSPYRISWLAASLAVMLGSGACVAQEVGFVDLTQIEARTELRHPAPRNGEEIVRKEGIREIHDCIDSPADAGGLRTTLVWLDRGVYSVGDQDKFEVRIANIGSAAIKIPFSPHLADLQPADASQKFAYSDLTVQLSIGGARWGTTAGGSVTLYGADRHPGTMLTVRPGEWVRIIGQGRINLDGVMDFVRGGDAATHANARIIIHRDETLLMPAGTATVSYGVCPNEQGPSVDVEVDAPR